MRPHLLETSPPGRFTFVVGKGGAGKSTTASALSVSWSAQDRPIHLISTDPAPSLTDIFGVSPLNEPRASPCSPSVQLEELDASRITTAWLDRMRAPLEQLIEQSTYLDGADVSSLTHLTLPGIDELGAALRLAELTSSGAHIVVDTAPTGHTLRLLDSADLIDSWAAVFRAMAQKVATIAMTMVHGRIRLAAEDTIDELYRTADQFRAALAEAQFIIAMRSDEVVRVETERLHAELQKRNLRVAAVVVSGDVTDGAKELIRAFAPAELVHVPWLSGAAGCDGLRAWSTAASVIEQNASAVSIRSAADTRARDGASHTAQLSGSRWLLSHTQRMMWFAGKGGVGKSTCASAAALGLASDRPVLLCSTDPAGSLRDVLRLDHPADGRAIRPNLRVLQVDAAAELEAWRAEHGTEVRQVFDNLGIGGSATLDREIMTAIWDAVPPGIDELFSLSEILDASDTAETIVVDAAPTGHFLRLIASPQMAIDWTHAILRVLLKYGMAGKLDGFSERVLAFARQLKQLNALLTDPAGCGVVAVTLDEPVVMAQTGRLLRSLSAANVHVLATVVNRGPAAGSARAAASGLPENQIIRAPALEPPPSGVRGLEEFLAKWELA